MLDRELFLDLDTEEKSEEEIKDEVRRAKLRALHLLTAMDRTEAKLREKFQTMKARWDADKKGAEKITVLSSNPNKTAKYTLINDIKFAIIKTKHNNGQYVINATQNVTINKKIIFIICIILSITFFIFHFMF